MVFSLTGGVSFCSGVGRARGSYGEPKVTPPSLVYTPSDLTSQALEPVLEEPSGKNGEATGADDSLFEITASIGQPGLEGRLKSARHSDGLLTLDVSMREFVELQRLDDNGRRFLLGLPAHCNPGITAMMARTSTVGRLVALITCTGSLHR